MSYKSKVIENHNTRASERIANRSTFIGRNVGVWIFVVWFLYPIGASISGLTEGFYLFHLLGESTNVFLRWAITIATVVMIEGSILTLGKGAIDDLQAGALAGTGGERALLTIKTMGFFAFFSLSIWLSLQGGPKFQEWRTINSTPVAALLIDEAEADEQYAADKQVQEAIIKSSRATTWKGRITRPAMNAIRTANKEITKINALIEAEKTRIRETNASTTLSYNIALEETTSRAYTLTGVGQIVVFFCIFFIGVFDQEVERGLGGTMGADAGAGGGSSASSRPIGFGRSGAAAHHPTGHGPSADPTATTKDDRKQIGFKHYTPTPPETGQSHVHHGDAANGSAPTGAPEDGDSNTVATRSYKPNQDGEWPLAAITRLNSYRAYKKEEGIYQKRSTPSAKTSLKKCREGIAYEEEQLAQMGIKIKYQEKPHRAYILVPLE